MFSWRNKQKAQQEEREAVKRREAREKWKKIAWKVGREAVARRSKGAVDSRKSLAAVGSRPTTSQGEAPNSRKSLTPTFRNARALWKKGFNSTKGSPVELSGPGDGISLLPARSPRPSTSPEGEEGRVSADPFRQLRQVTTQLAQQQALQEGKEELKTEAKHNEALILTAIPFLPLPVALLLLVFNIALPGFGTILSGFSSLFCGSARVTGSKDDQRVSTLCINFIVGLSQMLTVTFLLVGWFWSIAWGVNMVALSLERYEGKAKAKQKQLTAVALTAFGGASHLGRRQMDDEHN